MAKIERFGDSAGKIASKALKDPGALSHTEIKTLAASVLTQRPDKPKAKAASKAKPKSKAK